jgi:16S rRNA (uracil1498-N3)-methyltransferase
VSRRVYSELPLPDDRPDQVTLGDEASGYVARVLRLGVGASLQIFDADGRRCDAVLTSVEHGLVRARVVSWDAAVARPDSPLRVTLLMALLKGKSFEVVLQKATELGVGAIVPMVTERTVPEVRAERMQGRLERYRRICGEAARQCGRSSVPRLVDPAPLGAALADRDEQERLVLWEGERQSSLRQRLLAGGAPESVAVLVGPEGGLTAAEVRLAEGHGFVAVTLGARILRAETAPLAILSILGFVHGDLG